jgi:hypothetical protein
MERQDDLPVITAPAGAVRQLTDLHGRTFSCNYYRNVWPKVRQGFTPKEARIDLAGSWSWLDEVIQAVLRDRSLGGRFRIRDGRVYLASSNRQIAHIREMAHVPDQRRIGVTTSEGQ